MKLISFAMFVVCVLGAGRASAQSPVVVSSPIPGQALAAQPQTSSAGTQYCFGTVGCPCGNNDASPGYGCLNSSSGIFQHGAQLTASGVSKVTADTLVLNGSALKSGQLVIYFQGSLSLVGQAVAFSDGLRCVSGSAVRLVTKTATHDGDSAYGGPLGDTPISIGGQIPPIGGTFFYQAWYRDPQGVCASGAVNYTNALGIDWTP